MRRRRTCSFKDELLHYTATHNEMVEVETDASRRDLEGLSAKAENEAGRKVEMKFIPAKLVPEVRDRVMKDMGDKVEDLKIFPDLGKIYVLMKEGADAS